MMVSLLVAVDLIKSFDCVKQNMFIIEILVVMCVDLFCYLLDLQRQMKQISVS